MSVDIDPSAPNPATIDVNSGDFGKNPFYTLNVSDSFTFYFDDPNSQISQTVSQTAGVDALTDKNGITYDVQFSATPEYPTAICTGEDTFTVQVPTAFFNLVKGTDTISYDIKLTNTTTGGTADYIVDVAITDAAPPPPPFTEEQKKAFEQAAKNLDALGRALDVLQLDSTLWKAANWMASALVDNSGQTATSLANSVGQLMATAAGVVAGVALEGTNPVLLTLGVASTIDSLASVVLAILAADPPDSNYTTVYTAQPLGFTLPGASAVDQAFLTDSNNLLQNALVMLTAAERYEGAELANNSAGMALQSSAFSAALALYPQYTEAFNADLKALLPELVAAGVSDTALNNSGLAAAQAYYASVGLADPFLTALMHNGATTAQAQAYITAIEADQPQPLGGSAFATIATAASQITVQAETLGLYVALYGNCATGSGVTYWTNATMTFDPSVTTTGTTTAAISVADETFLGQQFVQTQSTYFNSQYAALNDTQFVTALYQNLTDSPGQPNGVLYWVGLLTAAEAANGNNVLSARAGLAGQFVHDVMGIDLTVGAAALGITAAQYVAAVAGQEAMLNKAQVAQFWATESQVTGGNILNFTSVTDPALAAAQKVLLGVTDDPATVTVAITGITNAVTHQNLSLA